MIYRWRGACRQYHWEGLPGKTMHCGGCNQTVLRAGPCSVQEGDWISGKVSSASDSFLLTRIPIIISVAIGLY